MEEIIFTNGAKAIPTELQDCYIIEPKYFGDERGYFVADFILEDMQKLGFDQVYQHNTSKSAKGVVRGMHFQLDPYAQTKIVSVISGAAVDVVIDIRVGSPTYGQATSVLLTPYDPNIPGSGRQLYVPRGFAHGFVSLKDNTLFQYYVDNKYAPQYEEGISWNGEETTELFKKAFDEYKISNAEITISAKDQARLSLKYEPKYFTYQKNSKASDNYSFEAGV
ncbi:MAG: dTDP-4-dehydrorhamnose 3,5-epimerase [Erysipelotrichales bacterium]|nr:dTDP-4-dehydrorhamnose 3,5-epimerase [Erysipelotrichales bacterium]